MNSCVDESDMLHIHRTYESERQWCRSQLAWVLTLMNCVINEDVRYGIIRLYQDKGFNDGSLTHNSVSSVMWNGMAESRS